MRGVLYVLIASVVIFSCKDDEESKLNSNLLTSEDGKSWILVFDSSEDEEDASCRVESERVQDNRFIFLSSGKFLFDNGEITGEEDSECEDCCTDLLDLYGKWKIKNGRLAITGEGVVEDGEEIPEDEQIELLNAKVKKLTSSVLEIEEDGVVLKFEAAVDR